MELQDGGSREYISLWRFARFSAQSMGTFPMVYLARGRALVIDVVFTS